MRLKADLPFLRTFERLKKFQECLNKSKLKVIHYSLQGNHFHLIVEAEDNETLSRAMKSFGSSLAKAINKMKKRTGKVFNGRFHMHVLKTPSEVKRALKYVFFNNDKHRAVRLQIDKFSSAHAFNDWRKLMGKKPPDFERLKTDLSFLAKPRSWLLKEGWTKAA